MSTTQYPKRLIEVDLPIKRISEHARREKSIRHGHISTLHIWWARRPLAACRAVICAALWPDPADPLCPQEFRDKAAGLITAFATRAATNSKLADSCSQESIARWLTLSKPENRLNPANPAHLNVLRFALLDFIADFANWDNSTVKEYLETSRALTQAAHEALGGEPGTKPLVVDPFAGGGSIPLEALRVGADAFASDLNPVAVLLNKVVLEYIPKYGQRLADEVRKWGEWIKKEAEKELAEFYPKDPDGAIPIAYLWARTVTCEGPGCGAEVPLMRSLWLAKKGSRSVALRMISKPQEKKVDFEIVQDVKGQDVGEGTVRRGSATCPVCGYTIPVASVRQQFKLRRGGSSDSRLLAVVTIGQEHKTRRYRLPIESDYVALLKAKNKYEKNFETMSNVFSSCLPPDGTLGFRVQKYGMKTWGDLFTIRQVVGLSCYYKIVSFLAEQSKTRGLEGELATAMMTLTVLAVDKLLDSNSGQVWWMSSGEKTVGTFTRQAISFIWDFAEIPLLEGPSRSWNEALEWIVLVISHVSSSIQSSGSVENFDAATIPLPDDSAESVFTDPPYYDAIPYSDLSNFFYVWMRPVLRFSFPSLFDQTVLRTPNEAIMDLGFVLPDGTRKDAAFFERRLAEALSSARRVLSPYGVGTFVFAHKTTTGWESMIEAILKAGWVVTATWPMDTERQVKVNTIDRAFLGSSIHLVCRPRENPDGSVRTGDIGDWRDVLAELPTRIHEWMPRLASEGVVGADAIFACLGPALEIFSRYSRVEKASGEQVILKEYLEYVWAAVAREALNMIFEGADATGFEEDARLTAMWLWTLSADRQALSADRQALSTGTSGNGSGDSESEEEEDEEASSKEVKTSGFVLEYDAARKIAQGLGAHLEHLASMVEIKGDKARLLPVAERTKYLFGKDEGKAPAKRKKKATQLNLFDALGEVEGEGDGWGEKNAPQLGNTVLDRIHQSMILFAAGRGEALKRFLVEDGAGRDQRFWRLAQALSALYPTGTDEKRWVDGVLARKKGLGF